MGYNPYGRKQSAELGLDYVSDDQKLAEADASQREMVQRDQQLELLRQLRAQADAAELNNKLHDPEFQRRQAAMDRAFETRRGVGKFTPVGTERNGTVAYADTPPPSRAPAFTEANFPAVSSRETVKPAVVKGVKGIARSTDSNTAFTDPDAAMSAREKAMIDPHVLAAQATGEARADKLTKVEHKDPATGRTVIEWLPESQLRGQSFSKGESATAETRLQSAEAVNQTGNDMIAKLADPAYAKNVGVAMGRYNSMRDFIGNPPPEYADLAGMIESYSLANMGVHGMRSAQGAEQIKKLLDQKHTPESLTATIRGLNAFSQHFMENAGRTVPTSSATPTSGSSSGNALLDRLNQRRQGK